MIATEEIIQMSQAERLEAMERLWESLSKDDAALASPAWHQQVLDARREIVDSGEADWLTIDALQQRLMRR